MLVAMIIAASGSVTLPLEDLEKLTRPAERPAPPVAAALTAQLLTARAGLQGVEVDGRYTVDVLGDRWAKLSLLELRPGIELVEVEQPEGATIASLGGALCFVSRAPGRYTFGVKLRLNGPRLVAGRDALWSTVDFEGEAVSPRDGGWTLVARHTPPKVAPVVERPPLDPSCPLARAQLVSTVEGHAQLDVTYSLKVDRERPLSFTAPAGWKVERVSVNGVPRQGAPLEVVVGPERDTDASVELQLSRELGVFHLSGRIDLELPQASLPVTRLELEVHLPAVFDYRRTGGSLEPAEAASEPSTLPGKRLPYRQHLISASAPTLELEYSVDLKGHYFSTRRHAF
jgi:hypothetical protein